VPLSASALAATLSQLLAPKSSSSSVFSRLQGTAPALPVSDTAAEHKAKRREKQQAQGGASIDAFRAAAKAAKQQQQQPQPQSPAKPRARTNKK